MIELAELSRLILAFLSGAAVSAVILLVVEYRENKTRLADRNEHDGVIG